MIFMTIVSLVAVGLAAAAKAGALPSWDKWGMWLDVTWLSSYQAGGLPPIDEPKGKSFLEILDEGVRRILTGSEADTISAALAAANVHLTLGPFLAFSVLV